MSTTSATSATTANPYAALNGTSSTQTANEAGSADRFLKLLVTQMQNQDPLNPMDNAQITSQMAQINTVSGIDKLNTTVEGLNTQFVQLQVLAGASLVGNEVTVKGNRLDIQSGTGKAGFDLAGKADAVKVEILDPSGRVADTLQLGAQTAGTHAFDWNAAGVADGSDYHFRVTATSGAAAVTSTLLMQDRVQSVSTTGSGLVLQTEHNGSVAYSDVKAFN